MASNWKKRISSSSSKLLRRTRPRSSPATCSLTLASEAVRRYDEEAEKCLRQLEFEAGLLNDGRCDRSSLQERASSVTTDATASPPPCAGSPDLLGTFCHLMQYVVHLRRENRHLRKQVLCLNEMRQIEKLQNELLRSACTCEAGATASSAFKETKSEQNESGEKREHNQHWRHSMPADSSNEGKASEETSTKSTSTSLATIVTNSAATGQDATAAVGPMRIQIRNSNGGEFKERMDETRSGRIIEVDARGQKSAPVTTSARAKVAATRGAITKIGQQADGGLKSGRFLAPPIRSTERCPLSASTSSGSVEGGPADQRQMDSVGKLFMSTIRTSQPDSSIVTHSLTRSLLSPSFWRPKSGRSLVSGKLVTSASASNSDRAIRHGAEEALAESGGDDRAFIMMHSSMGDDSSYSPRSMSSLGSSSLTKSLHTQLPSGESRDTSLRRYGVSTATSANASYDHTPSQNTFFLSPRYSDSDQEQSVFTEVQLPEYRRAGDERNRSEAPVGLATENKRNGSSSNWRYSDMSCISIGSGQDAGHAGPMVISTSGQKAGILGRLGLKRPNVLSKKRLMKTASIGEETGLRGKTNLITPLVSKSMYDEKVGCEDAVLKMGLLPNVQQPERWKLARKAFLKKRKRKISESDSLASSNASGKSYMTIELPDINYCRKASYPPAVPIITNVNVDYLSKNVSKEYARKMDQWREETKKKTGTGGKKGNQEGGLIRRMSQKGQQIKRSWLKKPKGIENEDASSGRYFEKDDGRQDTVIENEVNNASDEQSQLGWSVSDKMAKEDVSPNMEGLSESGHPERREDAADRPEQKARSVTFLEQLSPGETSASLTTSQQLTVSNDSVFTSLDNDLSCYRPDRTMRTTPSRVSAQFLQSLHKQQQQREEEEREQQKQASDVVEQLLVLQERNSLLIGTLKDKTREYERITERLCDLEKEVGTLRERHRFDGNLEQLYNAILEPNFVPINFVQELEKQIENLDQNIRVVKSEAYETQQMALETHANDQTITMRYLNQINSLQKANFHLLSKTLSGLNCDEYPEIRRQLNLLPTYEALYCFTISLLRKLKHIRTKLLEKNFSVSKLDLELLQTQSSLLLAHAQMERQKMEIRLLKGKYGGGECSIEKKMGSVQSVRRTHSYHGQELLARAVSAELSFYLPFKLHGLHTVKRNHTTSIQSLCQGDEALELEFAKLFDTVNRLSGHYDEIQVPLQNKEDRQKYEENHADLGGDRRHDSPPLTSRRHQQSSRPTSCTVPVKEMGVKRIAEEISAGRYFMSNSTSSPPMVKSAVKEQPKYVKKAPPPLRLGNVGQVKAMAAAFDGAGNDDANSAPNTPLPPSQLLQRRVVVKDTILTKSTVNQPSKQRAVKPASHCTGLDRSAGSRIPVRNESSQPASIYRYKSEFRTRTESPYETLTFVCRERNLASPPPVFPQLSPSTSGSMGLMEKSTSPEAETASSVASTAGSSWSISKRNEAKRLQFFYGLSAMQRDQQWPEMPTSPIPPCSPAPKTPPTPIPPTPTLPGNTSRFPEFCQSREDTTKGRQESGSFSVPEKTIAKKQSWFQKLRNKN